MKICYGPLLFLGLCIFLVSCSNAKISESPYNAPEYVEAQELKLKIRELADQLLSTVPNGRLNGYLAMPTSFVNLNNLQESSTFGRLVGESMMYEFNQRDFLVREYRLQGHIAIRPGQGNFTLNRTGIIAADERWTALIVGTYYVDKKSVFVNARLVRAADGMIYRSAQLILANNKYIARLFPEPVKFAMGTLSIKQKNN